MDREQAIKLMQDLLRRMVDRKGSDLFITAGFPPAIKIDGEVRPQTDKGLTPEQSAVLVRSITAPPCSATESTAAGARRHSETSGAILKWLRRGLIASSSTPNTSLPVPLGDWWHDSHVRPSKLARS